jgi:hypothetical protein
MALEIPNAIAASLVASFDPALAAGSQFTLRSSDGIAAKQSEFAAGAILPSVGLSLANPVAADHACVLSTGGNICGAPTTGVAVLSGIKGAAVVGVPEIDALPLHTLYASLVFNPPPAKALAHFSLAVLALP